MSYLRDIRSILSCFTGLSFSETLAYPKLNTLAGLPPELVLTILDFLPLVDIVCFSYCNYRLHELSTSTNVNIATLERLDRDYPSLFFCEFCEAFHRYNGSEAFSLSGLYDEVTGKLPNCIKNWWFTAPFLLPAAPDISSLHLKLAMKRLIHGPGSGINLESLGFEYVRHFSLEPDVSDALLLQSREFRAWSDRPGLYARLQTILLVSSWREFTESAFKHGFKNCYTHPIFKEIKVCTKKCLFDPETLQQFTGKPRDLLIPHYLDIPPGEQEVRKSLFCTACNCECQVRLYSFDSKTAVVITRWIDLGCGFLKKNDVYHIHGVCTFTRGPGQPCTILSNPDQNDPYAIAERPIETDKVSVTVEEGPWGCFETVASQASNTHDDLTLRNLIHLIDGDYKRDMSSGSPGSEIVVQDIPRAFQVIQVLEQDFRSLIKR